VVDIYGQRYHEGLEGIPARRWEEAMKSGFAARVPHSAAELAGLLGRVTHRTIQHYGIRFQSLRYNSSKLATLRTRLKGNKAKIKYHPADLSRLHVYNPFDHCYIEVPALDQEYTQGLSLWKHRIIRRAAREESGTVDLAALGRAKRKIQEIVDAGRSQKRSRTRTRIARWDTAGKPTRDLNVAGETGLQDEDDENMPTLETISGQLAELPLLDLSLDDEGWEITYDLPRSRRDLLETGNGETKHGEKD
jgi:putative transposase